MMEYFILQKPSMVTLMKTIKILLSTLITNYPVQIYFDKKKLHLDSEKNFCLSEQEIITPSSSPGSNLNAMFFIVIKSSVFTNDATIHPQDLLCLKCNIGGIGETY